MDVKKLIEEVLNNLANDKPLSSVVSKVQMISLILKDVKFKEWVDCEFFNGYFKDIDVPSYRKICILGVKAQIIVSKGFGGAVQYSNILLPIDLLGKETYNLIAEIPIKDSISVIQQLLENKGKKTSAVNSAEAQCIKTLVLEGQIIE
ncbi:MAG: hypothetical protein IMY73_05555, partial [Bacteroidetes bacterium]|nr:hypothetical protein [Bacteroidota bacterium]